MVRYYEAITRQIELKLADLQYSLQLQVPIIKCTLELYNSAKPSLIWTQISISCKKKEKKEEEEETEIIPVVFVSSLDTKLIVI